MAIQRVPVTGGCLCGAVRYESKKSPIRGYICHCTMCRRNCGGFFGATVRFPGAAFILTKGELKPYAASKFAKRCFCSDCGAPVAYFYAGNPDVWIYVGSLDHPEDWPMTKDASWGPTEHVYVDKKIAWYEIGDGLPQLTSASKTLLLAAQAYVDSLRQ
jgi:hypothetical protein